MSQQYDEYLHEHISNVQKAFWWMVDHGVIPPHLPGSVDILMMHDDSKYQAEEYDAYDDYFYGKEGKDEDDIQVIDSSFDYAWLHHIHHNPHHWQYWVLIGDDEGPKALEMPVSYAYEMIADWWSFSWKGGNLHEIFNWYEAHKDKMILHPNTRIIVEDALNQMRRILGEEKRDDEQTNT
jgi:hypothetical protein